MPIRDDQRFDSGAPPLATFLALLVLLSHNALAGDFTGSIHGSVSDHGGAPIGDARVRIMPPGDRFGGAAIETTTLDDGTYVIERTAPGFYTVLASHPDYLSYSTQLGDCGLSRCSLRDTSGLVEIEPGIGARQDIVLQLGGRIRGIVRDRDNSAISGARVTLSQQTTQLTVNTGDTGEYEFRGLGSGDYQISFSKTGFVKQKFDLSVLASAEVVENVVLNTAGSIVVTATARRPLTRASFVFYTDDGNQYSGFFQVPDRDIQAGRFVQQDTDLFVLVRASDHIPTFGDGTPCLFPCRADDAIAKGHAGVPTTVVAGQEHTLTTELVPETALQIRVGGTTLVRQISFLGSDGEWHEAERGEIETFAGATVLFRIEAFEGLFLSTDGTLCRCSGDEQSVVHTYDVVASGHVRLDVNYTGESHGVIKATIESREPATLYAQDKISGVIHSFEQDESNSSLWAMLPAGAYRMGASAPGHSLSAIGGISCASVP